MGESGTVIITTMTYRTPYSDMFAEQAGDFAESTLLNSGATNVETKESIVEQTLEYPP